MLPLLQIRVSELSVVPDELKNTALLVLFHNTEEHPFNEPNGQGWEIREYESLDGLVPLPNAEHTWNVRPFPMRWHHVEDDHPGWEDCWSLIDITAIHEDRKASEAFFDRFKTYPHTKVGGYPAEIQHGVGLDGFVFQVGSEEKPNWMWADNGIGYFFKRGEKWEWACQFY